MSTIFLFCCHIVPTTTPISKREVQRTEPFSSWLFFSKKPLTGQESNIDYYTTVHRIHLCFGVSVLKQNTFLWSAWSILENWWQYFKNLYETSSSLILLRKEIMWVSVHFFLRIWYFSYQFFERKMKICVEILDPCISKNYCFVLDL